MDIGVQWTIPEDTTITECVIEVGFVDYPKSSINNFIITKSILA